MIQNLTTEQRKKLAAKRIDMKVSPYEALVILELRKLEHAEVIVVIMDGIPYRCKLNTSVMMEQSEDFEGILAQVAKESV